MAWRVPQTESIDEVGPRAAHSCNLVGDMMYVFGGWNGRKGLNDLHQLDLSTMKWSSPETHGDRPSTRNNHATFTYGRKLYVHGGHDGTKWLDDIYCLDLDTMVWSIPDTAGKAPSSRACHTTTVLGRKVFLFGGYDGARCFNELDILDMDLLTWTRPIVRGTKPMARNAQTMTVVGKKLILFGGHSGNKHLRDLHVFDTETMTWEEPGMYGDIPPGLRGHTATLVGSKIYLFGGYDGRGRSDDLFILDTDTRTWHHPPSIPGTPTGRQRHTACLVRTNQLFLLGGFDGVRWLNDIHILDVAEFEAESLATESTGSLLTDMLSLVNNPAAFPDVTFMVDGQAVYAHRGILAARSQHFRSMFSSQMVEATAKEIPIADWGHDCFIKMLEYLYTGQAKGLSPNLAVECLRLADHSGLDGLKHLCETTLLHMIDNQSVVTLLCTAHHCNAKDLKKQCNAYILENVNIAKLLAPGSENHTILRAEPELLMELLTLQTQRSSIS